MLEIYRAPTGGGLSLLMSHLRIYVYFYVETNLLLLGFAAGFQCMKPED